MQEGQPELATSPGRRRPREAVKSKRGNRNLLPSRDVGGPEWLKKARGATGTCYLPGTSVAPAPYTP